MYESTISIGAVTVLPNNTASVQITINSAAAVGERPSLVFCGPRGQGTAHKVFFEIVQ